jgi:thioesterase domain-containing protein
MTGTIGIHEDFFMLGGDSLQAVELLALIEWKLGHALPQSVFIEHGTIAKMAEHINQQGPSACVVPIQPKGSRPPFFCVSHVEGEILSLRNLARRLGEDQPFYGIQAVGIDGKQAPLTRIEDMAAHYLREIRMYQPTGPYYLGGYSMGGIVAYEMVKQLKAQGEEVGILALIDTYCGPARMRFVASEWLRRRWTELSAVRVAEIGSYVVRTLRELGRRVSDLQFRVRHEVKWRLMRLFGRKGIEVLRAQSLWETNAMAVWAYHIERCECDAVLFKTDLNTWQDPAMHDRWRDVIGSSLEVRRINGSHYNFLSEPHVRLLAAELQGCLENRYSRHAAKCS